MKPKTEMKKKREPEMEFLRDEQNFSKIVVLFRISLKS